MTTRYHPTDYSKDAVMWLFEQQEGIACGPAGSLPKGSRLSRRGDPETSKAAAARVEPELGKSQAWLLHHIKLADVSLATFTDKELVLDVSFMSEEGRPRGLHTGSGIRTRRHELAKAGHLELVRDAQGAVVKRQGCRVWRLT